MAEPVYAPVIVAAKGMFKVMGLKIDLRGGHHVPRTGGAVLASNHVSYLDFIFAGLAADPSGRYVRFMAKEDVWDHWAGGPLMRGMKHIPVDRAAGAASLAKGLAVVKQGEVVGVFPEAGISLSYELKSFKNGAARMAADGGVPLVPVALWGGQRLLTKGHRHLHRGIAISINVGEPLRPAKDDNVNEVTAELRRRVDVLLQDAMDRYPQQPHGESDRWWLPAARGGTAPTPEEAHALEIAERKARAAAAREKQSDRP